MPYLTTCISFTVKQTAIILECRYEGVAVNGADHTIVQVVLVYLRYQSVMITWRFILAFPAMSALMHSVCPFVSDALRLGNNEH